MKLILILPILFEAISEGLYLSGHKVWSKQIQVLLIASWFLIAFIFAWEAIQRIIPDLKQLSKLLGRYIIIYVLLRFAVFNYVHNIAAGLRLDYIGTVSFIDRLLALALGGNLWVIIIAQIGCLVGVWYMVKGKMI